MRDPHVEWLRYRIGAAPNITYDQPPPIDIEYEEFSGHLENGILNCLMKEDYPSSEAARRVVDQYLRAWEIDAALKYGRREIQFIFEDGKVIDRNPPPPSSNLEIQVSSAFSATGSISASLHVTLRKYPEPPKMFRVSPEVETLWHRYQMYLEGKEPLPSMAYFCLTLLELIERPTGDKERRPSKKRIVASEKFKIDLKVLMKLGEFTSKGGDYKEARKAQPTPIPLAGKERAWIEAAVKKLIRQVGEIESDSRLAEVSMEDLPPL
jgi:hypothetical protein